MLREKEATRFLTPPYVFVIMATQQSRVLLYRYDSLKTFLCIGLTITAVLFRC